MSNLPVTVDATSLQREVHRSFDSYLMNQVIPELGVKNVPANWDDADWNTCVVGIILNKTDVMIFDDLRLSWQQQKFEEKLIGEKGVKFIATIRKHVRPFMDELRELLQSNFAQYATFADKFARVERLSWLADRTMSEIQNNILNSETIRDNKKEIELYLKISTAINKEAGINAIFTHVHKHQQELDFDEESLEKAAEKLGVPKTQLLDTLLENKYSEQLI